MSVSGKCFKRRVFHMLDKDTEWRRTSILWEIVNGKRRPWRLTIQYVLQYLQQRPQIKTLTLLGLSKKASEQIALASRYQPRDHWTTVLSCQIALIPEWPSFFFFFSPTKFTHEGRNSTFEIGVAFLSDNATRPVEVGRKCVSWLRCRISAELNSTRQKCDMSTGSNKKTKTIPPLQMKFIKL